MACKSCVLAWALNPNGTEASSLHYPMSICSNDFISGSATKRVLEKGVNKVDLC